MRKFTEELHQKVQLSIQNVSDQGEVGFEFYNSCYSITKAALGELKEYVYKYRFKDRAEEIVFFKEIKPTFLAQLQYYKELLEIEVKKPTITEKRYLIKYYQTYGFRLPMLFHIHIHDGQIFFNPRLGDKI